MLKIVESTNRKAVRALLAPERGRDAATERVVASIVADVRRDGDRALLRYARKFDRLDGPLEVTPTEMREAAALVPRHVRAAIRAAARNIRAVARRQTARQLLRALALLPDEQREAFLLHEEGGLTLEEIAVVTGVGRETVKSRLRYALAKLRQELNVSGMSHEADVA
jgi:RNA polymerase sigma factor (sigma-70 family)